MRIVSPNDANDPDWLSLRLKLWRYPEHEHRRDMTDVLGRRHRVLLALNDRDLAIGFVEASKRVDYVNGTNSSPVAFLEGLYVEPCARRKGVARALVAAVEQWAVGEGCTEL